MAQLSKERVAEIKAMRGEKVGLWLTIGEVVWEGMADRVSREYALDHQMVNPDQYPSWPEYPDGRGLPVALAARDRFRERTAHPEVRRFVCDMCKEPHLTAGERWHDEESRLRDMALIAEKTGFPVEEVENRLGIARNPNRKPNAAITEQITERAKCQRAGCPNPVKEHTRGMPSVWCSDACRMLVKRQKAVKA